MRIVIACAARKHSGGTFATTDGRRVIFVADTAQAPESARHVYARPDDRSDDGRSWRARLLAYQDDGPRNPLALLPAYQLYAHDVYRALVERFGVDDVFILSAGWGLIPAAFLTPAYDITFTRKAAPLNRRRKNDRYEDFCLMPDDGAPILFLGGQDYLPLFCRLGAGMRGTKTVVFNSTRRPDLPDGFTALRYQTRTRTNWHYEPAHDLVAGQLSG